MIILHIRTQNAAVICQKTKEGIILSSFEVLPDNESIMSTKGRVLVTLPTRSIVIDQATLDNPLFQDQLVQFLCGLTVDITHSDRKRTKK